MVHFLPKLALAVSTVGALLVVSQYPAVAVPMPPHPGAAVPAPAPVGAVNSAKGTISLASLGLGKRRACSPIAKGDNVHISSTAPATASGHGWWNRGNCTAARAVVSIFLQEHFSDGSWRARGQGGREPSYLAGAQAIARPRAQSA